MLFWWDADYYVSYRSPMRKCFTINSPFPKNDLLWSFYVSIKNSIFPDGKRSDANRIYTYIHYPGQRLTAFHTVKYEFPTRLDKSNDYVMDFDVRNIDIITWRNKFHEPCVEDWRNYDQIFMKSRMNDIGCHPSHWKIDSNLPICSSAKQMKNVSYQPATYKVETSPQPCRIIDRLDYTYTERDMDSDR